MLNARPIALSELVDAIAENMSEKELKECAEEMEQENLIKRHAEEMERLENQLAQKENNCVNLIGELVDMAAQRDEAIKDIPHRCWTCKKAIMSPLGAASCGEGNYKNDNTQNVSCINWVWRGQKED